MGGDKGDGKALEVDSVPSPPLEPGISILLSIDCVVLTSSSEATETSQQLQLRVQGKEKHQMLEISLSPVSRKSAAHAPPVSWSVSRAWASPNHDLLQIPSVSLCLPSLGHGEKEYCSGSVLLLCCCDTPP